MASEFVRKIDDTRIEEEPKETSESGDLLITRPIKDDDYGDLSKFDKDTQGGVYGHIGNQYRRLDNGVDLEAEENRAKKEEARLDKKIDDETERAKGEEARLDKKIYDETTRAKGEEARLDKKITDETTRAKGAESDLQQSVDQIFVPTVENIFEKVEITNDDTDVIGSLLTNGAYVINYSNYKNFQLEFRIFIAKELTAGATTYPVGKLTGDYAKDLLPKINNIYSTDGSAIIHAGTDDGIITLKAAKNIPAETVIYFNISTFIPIIPAG